MCIKLGVPVLFLAFVLPSLAFAGVIYDNGGPDAATGGSDSTVFTSLNPDFTSFDNFVLQDGNSTITDVHWWGNYYEFFSEQLDDNFVLYIYGDESGHPDLTAGALFVLDGSATQRTDAGLDVGGDSDVPIFQYDLLVDPIELDPGVTYWLAVTNGFHWRWQTSTLAGSSYQVGGINFPDEIGDWEGELDTHDINLAFNLTGSVVPEPSTGILLAAGLAALLIHQRRRRA